MLETGDIVARLGGDEFVVLLKNIADLEVAERVARRISSKLEEPFDLDGREASITVSIGIALGSTSGDRPNALLRAADLAMYRAKEREGPLRGVRCGMRVPATEEVVRNPGVLIVSRA